MKNTKSAIRDYLAKNGQKGSSAEIRSFINENKDKVLGLIGEYKEINGGEFEILEFIAFSREKFSLPSVIPLDSFIKLITYSVTTGNKLNYDSILKLIPQDTSLSDNLKITKKEKLIKNQGEHLAQGLVEIIANACDASNPSVQVGRFGEGFFQSLRFLQEFEDAKLFITTKKGDSKAFEISLIENENEIRVGSLSSKKKDIGTIVRLEANLSKENIDYLGKFISSRFGTNPYVNLYINGKRLNDLEEFVCINGQKLDTSLLPNVKITLDDKGFSVEDFGVGMDSKTICEKLLIPTSSSKSRTKMDIEETKKFADEHTKFFYKRNKEKNEKTVVRLQVAGVVNEEFECETTSDISIFSIETPFFEWVPEAKNQVLPTRGVVLTIEKAISKIFNKCYSIEEKIELSEIVGKIISRLKQRKNNETERKYTLDYIGHTAFKPFLDELENSGKTVLPADDEIRKIIGNRDDIVYVSPDFVTFDITNIPGIKRLEGVKKEQRPFFAIEFGPEATHDYLIHRTGILVNSKYLQAISDSEVYNITPIDILNTSINLNIGYEIKSDEVFYGTIIPDNLSFSGVIKRIKQKNSPDIEEEIIQKPRQQKQITKTETEDEKIKRLTEENKERIGGIVDGIFQEFNEIFQEFNEIFEDIVGYATEKDDFSINNLLNESIEVLLNLINGNISGNLDKKLALKLLDLDDIQLKAFIMSFKNSGIYGNRENSKKYITELKNKTSKASFDILQFAGIFESNISRMQFLNTANSQTTKASKELTAKIKEQIQTIETSDHIFNYIKLYEQEPELISKITDRLYQYPNNSSNEPTYTLFDAELLISILEKMKESGVKIDKKEPKEKKENKKTFSADKEYTKIEDFTDSKFNFFILDEDVHNIEIDTPDSVLKSIIKRYNLNPNTTNLHCLIDKGLDAAYKCKNRLSRSEDGKNLLDFMINYFNTNPINVSFNDFTKYWSYDQNDSGNNGLKELFELQNILFQLKKNGLVKKEMSLDDLDNVINPEFIGIEDIMDPKYGLFMNDPTVKALYEKGSQKTPNESIREIFNKFKFDNNINPDFTDLFHHNIDDARDCHESVLKAGSGDRIKGGIGLMIRYFQSAEKPNYSEYKRLASESKITLPIRMRKLFEIQNIIFQLKKNGFVQGELPEKTEKENLTIETIGYGRFEKLFNEIIIISESLSKGKNKPYENFVKKHNLPSNAHIHIHNIANHYLNAPNFRKEELGDEDSAKLREIIHDYMDNHPDDINSFNDMIFSRFHSAKGYSLRTKKYFGSEEGLTYFRSEQVILYYVRKALNKSNQEESIIESLDDEKYRQFMTDFRNIGMVIEEDADKTIDFCDKYEMNYLFLSKNGYNLSDMKMFKEEILKNLSVEDQEKLAKLIKGYFDRASGVLNGKMDFDDSDFTANLIGNIDDFDKLWINSSTGHKKYFFSEQAFIYHLNKNGLLNQKEVLDFDKIIWDYETTLDPIYREYSKELNIFISKLGTIKSGGIMPDDVWTMKKDMEKRYDVSLDSIFRNRKEFTYFQSHKELKNAIMGKGIEAFQFIIDCPATPFSTRDASLKLKINLGLDFKISEIMSLKEYFRQVIIPTLELKRKCLIINNGGDYENIVQNIEYLIGENETVADELYSEYFSLTEDLLNLFAYHNKGSSEYNSKINELKTRFLLGDLEISNLEKTFENLEKMKNLGIIDDRNYLSDLKDIIDSLENYKKFSGRADFFVELSEKRDIFLNMHGIDIEKLEDDSIWGNDEGIRELLTMLKSFIPTEQLKKICTEMKNGNANQDITEKKYESIYEHPKYDILEMILTTLVHKHSTGNAGMVEMQKIYDHYKNEGYNLDSIFVNPLGLILDMMDIVRTYSTKVSTDFNSGKVIEFYLKNKDDIEKFKQIQDGPERRELLNRLTVKIDDILSPSAPKNLGFLTDMFFRFDEIATKQIRNNIKEIKIESSISEELDEFITELKSELKKHPQDLAAFAEFLNKGGEFLKQQESIIKIESSQKFNLSDLISGYRLHNEDLRGIESKDELDGFLGNIKSRNYNPEFFNNEIRSSIDGQDESAMIWVRELVQNSRDAILSIPGSSKNIEIDFYEENTKWVSSVKDPIGMSLKEVFNYLLVPGESSKTGANSEGMFGQGFYSTAIESEEVRIKTSKGDGQTVNLIFKPILNKGGLIHDFEITYDISKEEYIGTLIERVDKASGIGGNLRALVGVHNIQKYVGNVEDVNILYKGENIANQKELLEKVEVPGYGEIKIFETSDRICRKTKNNLFIRELPDDYLSDLPDWMVKFVTSRNISIEVPSGMELTKTRNSLAQREKNLPILKPYLFKAFVDFSLKAFVDRNTGIRIPMLPEDYLRLEDIHFRYSPQITIISNKYNSGKELNDSEIGILKNDSEKMMQFLIQANFEHNGQITNLREMKQEILRKREIESRSRLFNEYQQTSFQESESLNIGMESDFRDKGLSLEKIAEYTGYPVETIKAFNEFMESNFFALSQNLYGNGFRNGFYKRKKQENRSAIYDNSNSRVNMYWNVDNVGRWLADFDDPVIRQQIIETTTHEIVHMLENKDKLGSHEKDIEHEKSFEKIQRDLLTKMQRI